VNPLPNLAPSWNVAPTADCAVVRRHPETDARHLDLLKWSLLPYWTNGTLQGAASDQRPLRDRGRVGHVQGRERRDAPRSMATAA
jgi:putative SOS response-associated peptidase YedK